MKTPKYEVHQNKHDMYHIEYEDINGKRTRYPAFDTFRDMRIYMERENIGVVFGLCGNFTYHPYCTGVHDTCTDIVTCPQCTIALDKM
jgi:hypothetical protein